MFRNSKSYFSLLEIVLAMLILAGSITPLLYERSVSLRRTMKTAEDRQALQLLKSKMKSDLKIIKYYELNKE